MCFDHNLKEITDFFCFHNPQSYCIYSIFNILFLFLKVCIWLSEWITVSEVTVIIARLFFAGKSHLIQFCECAWLWWKFWMIPRLYPFPFKAENVSQDWAWFVCRYSNFYYCSFGILDIWRKVREVKLEESKFDVLQYKDIIVSCVANCNAGFFWYLEGFR